MMAAHVRGVFPLVLRYRTSIGVKVPFRDVLWHAPRKYAAHRNHGRSVCAYHNSFQTGVCVEAIAVGDDGVECVGAAIVQVRNGLAVGGGHDRGAFGESGKECAEKSKGRRNGVCEAGRAVPFSRCGGRGGQLETSTRERCGVSMQRGSVVGTETI